jgi:L-threonylcarbamoyladenylate synthase
MAKVWQATSDSQSPTMHSLDFHTYDSVDGTTEELPPSVADAVAEAGQILRSGGLVAFPTETVYGLGANARDEQAVGRIFAVKGRPADNPLIVHIADVDQLPQVVRGADQLPDPVRRAIDAFWPGPLTLILPVADGIAPSVHPGTDTVGVRLPAHPLARALIRAAGCPIAAPSANRSGRPSPTVAADVLEDLGDDIDGVLDGGACNFGIESTVVEVGADVATIYRPGSITREQLQQTLGVPVELDPHLTGADEDTTGIRSPGMKYRHYAPNAEVHVWWGDSAKVLVAMMEFIDAHPGKSLAVISERPFAGRCKSWAPVAGERYELALARHLYRLLREFDRHGVDYILVQGVAPTGVGAAVMNRLYKASEGRVSQV